MNDYIDWDKLQDELSAEVTGRDPDRYPMVDMQDSWRPPHIILARNHWDLATDGSAALEYWAAELDRLGWRFGGTARMVQWSHIQPVIGPIYPDRSDDDPATLAWRRAGDGLRRYRVGRAIGGRTTQPDRRAIADFYLALTIPVQPRLPKRVRPADYDGIWSRPQVDNMARLAQARPRTPLTAGEVARVQATRRRAPAQMLPATLARVYRGLRRYRGTDNIWDFD